MNKKKRIPAKMKIFKIVSLFGFCFFYLSITQLYSRRPGTSGATLLKETVGGRQTGLGESFVSVADDIYTLHYNPAGLAFLPKREVGAMYVRGIVDTSYMFAGYSQRLGKIGTLGGSILHFHGGDINLFGNIVNAQQDYVYTVGYGKRILNNLSIGVNAKIIHSVLIEKYKATAYAADIGLLYKPLRNLSIGASLQNLGTKLTFKKVGDPLPLTARLGVSYRTRIKDNSFLLSLDTVRYNDCVRTKVHTGLEYGYKNLLFIRGGYKFGYDLESYTFGIGVTYRGFQLDWGLNPMGALEQATRISFGMQTDEPPDITIISPSNNSELSGTATINVDASDDNTISKVEFYIDGKLRYSDLSFPYQWRWDTRKADDGLYSIKAIAYDSSKQTAADEIVIIVNQPDKDEPMLEPLKDLMTEKGIIIEKTEHKEAEKKQEIIKITATEEAIHFDFGSADIKKENYKVLDKLVDFLLTISACELKIYGHTDNLGDAEYNKQLSVKRAEAVKNYFTESGIRVKKITTRGYGETKPIASNKTKSGRAKNRRVEIIIRQEAP